MNAEPFNTARVRRFGVPALAGLGLPNPTRAKLFNTLNPGSRPPAKAGTPYH
jgi:hypothetical protein